MALVKPQFEAGRKAVGKGGIVRSEAEREKAVTRVWEFLAGRGLEGRSADRLRRSSAAAATQEFLIGARHGE